MGHCQSSFDLFNNADFNHPLASQSLKFEAKIISIL